MHYKRAREDILIWYCAFHFHGGCASVRHEREEGSQTQLGCYKNDRMILNQAKTSLKAHYGKAITPLQR